jgi:hypothetical protein
METIRTECQCEHSKHATVSKGSISGGCTAPALRVVLTTYGRFTVCSGCVDCMGPVSGNFPHDAPIRADGDERAEN